MSDLKSTTPGYPEYPAPPVPDEQFIDVLEQRIRLGIARRTKFDPDPQTMTGFHRKGRTMLGSASLVLLSMMLGATGTYAVVHHDPAPLRELHVQKASILLEKALLRLEQRQENLDELTPLIERDFVNSIEADRYRQKLVEAEVAIAAGVPERM